MPLKICISWSALEKEKRRHAKKRDPKERGRERSEGRIKRERELMQAGVSHNIIHLVHTQAHLDLDCMICFSMDPLFDSTTDECK